MGNVNEFMPSTGRFMKEDSTVVNLADLMEVQLGKKGSEFISDTIVHNAPKHYAALQVLTDAILASYTTETGAEITGNSLIGAILPSGTVLYGRFTSIKLTSGQILAYKGV